MKKSILGATALAMLIAASAVPLSASAKDRYPEMMKMADTDKDGMVSKQEFLDMVARMYDERVAKINAMDPAKRVKFMKDDRMTIDAYRAMLRELQGGQ